MTDVDPFVLSYHSQNPTKELLDIRSSFPPRAPLTAQLEVAWLEGDDETALRLNDSISRIQEITGRHDII